MQKQVAAGALFLGGDWGSRSCVFSGCISAVHRSSACASSSGAAENRSHWRAEAQQVSHLCIALPVIVVSHYILVFFSEI